VIARAHRRWGQLSDLGPKGEDLLVGVVDNFWLDLTTIVAVYRDEGRLVKGVWSMVRRQYSCRRSEVEGHNRSGVLPHKAMIRRCVVNAMTRQ
jgi:hypothetical protein